MIDEDYVYLDGAQGGSALGATNPASWRTPGAWSWILVERPTERDLEQVQQATGLDTDVLMEAWHAPSRPTLAVTNDAAIVGYRLARYRSDQNRLEPFDVVLAFGPDFVVVVTEESELVRALRKSLADTAGALVRGPTAVFEASAELAIDSYLDVIDGLDADVKQVERVAFSDRSDSSVKEIYRLRRAVTDLEELVTRLNEEPHERLIRRRMPAWMSQDRDWFEDPGSLAELDRQFDRMIARVQSLRGLLDSILNANLVQVGIQQNTDMRKISAWVAIAAIPAMVGGIYGMNFEHMPELTWRYSYPVALLLIAIGSGLLYWRFKKNDWL